MAAAALVEELPAPIRGGLEHARRLEQVLGEDGLGVAAMLPYDLDVR